MPFIRQWPRICSARNERKDITNLSVLCHATLLECRRNMIRLFNIARSFPAIRSRPPLDPRAAHHASLIAAIGGCALPVVIGIFVVVAAMFFKPKPASDLELGLAFLALLLLASPIFSFWATLPACFMSHAAISAGLAGWLMAVFGGAVVSTAVFATAVLLGFSMQGHPIVVGCRSGSFFWPLARFSTPSAFIASSQHLSDA